MERSDDMMKRRHAHPPSQARRPVNGGRDARLAETTLFGANPGSLRMLSYAPTGLVTKSPLVVVLHGCTQNAADNAAGAGWLQLADRLGFAVLAPEQTAANNMNRCFNWFLRGDTRRELGECASIAQMIGDFTRSQNLDPGRVFITGLSAGGAMAAAMLATYPELFAGGAIIAGLPYGVAHNLQEAMLAMRGVASQDEATLTAFVIDAAARPATRPFRLSIWHGDKDMVVDPSNAHALIRQWTLAKGALHITSNEQVSGRRTQTRWGDTAQDGTLIELNMIHGLGHGTPMSTTGPGGVGSPAPFLLECGVSSTVEIARFWELDEQLAQSPTTGQEGHSAPRSGVAAHVLASLERHVSREIQDAIAQSLRAAGLLK